MLRSSKLLSLFSALALAIVVAGAAQAADNELTFKAHNAAYSADGSFTDWKFTKVSIPDGNLEKASFEIEVNLASVSEKSPDLAAHLRTPDFFDVAKFATATITVGGITKTGDDTYTATATVNLHGLSGDVPVSFKVTSHDPLMVEGTGTLNRTAFGIGKPYEEGNKYAIVEGVEIGLKATIPHAM